ADEEGTAPIGPLAHVEQRAVAVAHADAREAGIPAVEAQSEDHARGHRPLILRRRSRFRTGTFGSPPVHRTPRCPRTQPAIQPASRRWRAEVALRAGVPARVGARSAPRYPDRMPERRVARAEAEALLFEFTHSDALRKHARAV